MMKFLKILILATVLSVAMNAVADDKPESPVQPIPKREVGPINPGKHKVPSFIRIYIVYDAVLEHSTFTFPADVEYIDIEAEHLSTHTVYVGSASVDYPTWQQSLPAGEYIITCTADTGDIFEGYVYI